LANIDKYKMSGKYSDRYIERIARSSDASFLTQTPQSVFYPDNEEDVLNILTYARANGRRLTFRAAATSLSGQTLAPDICVDISRAFKQVDIGQDTITCEPGVVLDYANKMLIPLGRRIGPDPASGKAAMIGGVVANNASGIRSGVRLNSYHTLKGIRIVLPNGTVLDTMREGYRETFENENPDYFRHLQELRLDILADKSAAARIAHLHSMKNTMGYYLRAFLDFEHPADILARLMIGSEGTLGFISKVQLQTLQLLPYKSTILLGFDSLEAAVKAVAGVRKLKPEAIELIDGPAIASIKNVADLPEPVYGLSTKNAALLIEFGSPDESSWLQRSNAIHHSLTLIPTLFQTAFMTDTESRDRLWRVRKALFATTGAGRPSGSAIITEDVVVPPAKMLSTMRQLKTLFQRYHLHDAAVFGHANDASFHFNFSIDFKDSQQRNAYHAFSDELANLICTEMGGVLKGEHGTGRAVAKYLELQWGPTITGWMRKIKEIVDPDDIFNPGAIFTASHKVWNGTYQINATVDETIDHCVECGFCENVCPSSRYTLTPRQRIMVWRHQQLLQDAGMTNADPSYRSLREDIPFYLNQTCAVDGLCQVNCPLDIDTGAFVKNVRRKSVSPAEVRLAGKLSANYGFTLRLARFALSTARSLAAITSAASVRQITHWFNQKTQGRFPVWNQQMTTAISTGRSDGANEPVDYLLFGSCVTGVFGDSGEDKDSVFLRLAAKTGLKLEIKGKNQCCGLTFQSKGLTSAYSERAREWATYFYQQSDNGAIPIILDNSPCSQTILGFGRHLRGTDLAKWQSLILIDSIDFVHDTLLPRLQLQPIPVRVFLHPVCSVEKMGQKAKLRAITRACAVKVIEPLRETCCGAGGDRGFRYPGLPQNALMEEKAQIARVNITQGVTSSKTCEINLSNELEKPFRHFIHLVDEAAK
jgi:D-lactate dehydrogenase